MIMDNYKEKIEAAKKQLREADAVEYNLPDSAHAIRTTVYAIFPELAESEDEKIKKGLIEFVQEYGDKFYSQAAKGSAFAWLEKQGEQKPVAMIQWTGDNLKEVVEFTGKSPNFDKWFKSQEEYEGYVRSHNNIFKLFIEDGSHCEIPVGAWIIKTPDGYNVASKFGFVPKPVERSKEDKNRLTSVIEDMEDYYEHNYNKHNSEWPSMENRRIVLDKINRNILWLKYFCPQKQWKPTEEQIKTLSNAVDKLEKLHYISVGGNSSYPILKSLLEQLKALL